MLPLAPVLPVPFSSPNENGFIDRNKFSHTTVGIVYVICWLLFTPSVVHSKAYACGSVTRRLDHSSGVRVGRKKHHSRSETIDPAPHWSLLSIGDVPFFVCSTFLTHSLSLLISGAFLCQPTQTLINIHGTNLRPPAVGVRREEANRGKEITYRSPSALQRGTGGTGINACARQRKNAKEKCKPQTGRAKKEADVEKKKNTKFPLTGPNGSRTWCRTGVEVTY